LLNMFNKTKGKDGLVGIYFYPDSVTLAHVSSPDKNPELKLCQEFKAETAADKVKVLEKQVEKLGLEDTRASFILSPSDYKLFLVESPEVEAGEMAGAVKWKIKDLIDQPVDEMAITVFPVPDDAYRSQNEMVYAVAARKSRIHEIVNMVNQTGLVLDVIDIPELVMKNLTAVCADDSVVNGDAAQYVNALHVRRNGHIILSTENAGSSIAGVAFEPGDLVVYDPILDSATLLFDGSTIFNGGVGNIDAIFEQDNGDLVISTAESTGIGGTTWQRGDWVLIDGTTPTVSTVLLDGDGAAVFNADVQLDGTYFKFGGTPDYVITIGQTNANIATGNTSFTGDDIVSLQPGVDSQIEFRGSIPNGVFDPLLSSRFIDGVHLVEDEYFGHFSIVESVSGDTCTPTTVVISKHTFENAIDTTYTGSILIDMDYVGAASWSIIEGDGTLTPVGGPPNRYVYTFVPTDNGEVTLALTVATDGVSVNVDVTNGLRSESPGEDPTLTFNDSISVVTYGDNFATNDYTGNSGTSHFSGSWSEVDADDGAEDPGVGNVRVIGGEAYFDNTPNAVINSGGGNDDLMPGLVRSVDLSLYSLASTLTLTFDWRTVSANSTDSFIVEVRGDADTDPWLEVDTFTSLTGTNAGSESYDLDTILGLGAQVVSDKTQVRFRVEDNYDVTGNFIIDDVLLTTGTADCGVGSVHHYDISHIGSGVMCEAYSITFEAHDVAHTPVAPGLSTVVNLTTTPALGSWSALPGYPNLVDASLGDGAATYTFPVGETFFQANFNLTAPNVNNATATINFNIAQGALTEQTTTLPVDPDFNFVQAGFIFYDAYSSDNPSSASKTLGTQIAGKFSSAAPNTPIIIRAVETDMETMACLALFADEAVTLQMGAECKDPGACLAGAVTVVEGGLSPGNQVIPTNTDDGNPVTVAAANVEVILDFNADGEAEIDMMYTDAGEIQLYAEYDIRLNNDPSGLESGDIMFGVSDPLVVRPFGINFDLSANLTPTISVDDTGTAFQRAGQPFSINLQAVAYDVGDDGNFDGIPDSGADLSDNALTPNFGNESVTPTVTITHALVLPAGGDAGLLSGSTTYNNFSGGQELHANIAFSEVGILNLTATLSAGPGYLNSGVGIEGNTQNIGRFTPDHYTITMISHQDRGALGAACVQPSTFTYMGEDLGFVFDIEARNSSNAITRNYYNGFDKLDTNGEINFTALDTMTMDILTGQLDVSTPFSFGWGANPGVDTGEGSISGTLVLDKGGSPEGLFNDFAVGIVPNDEDGINMLIADLNLDGDLDLANDTFQLLTTSMRYGRLAINSASGSEISISTVSGAGADIPITLEVEYFDSVAGNFINNGIDDCSPFDSQYLSVVTGSYTDGLAANGTLGTPTVGVNVVPLTGTVGVLDNGRTSANSEDGIDPDPPMYLSSPFEADHANPQTGSVVIELDLDALGLDFLKFNWHGANPADPYDDTPDGGNVEDNPRAIIDFGIMPRHNRVINWQEIIPAQ